MKTLKMHETETVKIGAHEYLTRFWLMDCAKDLTGQERHDRFYGQFAPFVWRFVEVSFSKREWAALEAAADQVHLNGVFGLDRWDRVDVRHLVAGLVTRCSWANVEPGQAIWSKSENICIVKAAVKAILADRKAS